MLTKYYDTMIKRDPFDSMWSLFGSDVFSDFLMPRRSHDASQYRARLEKGDNGSAILTIELPGIKPADVVVESIGQKLTISYSLRGKKAQIHYEIDSEFDASSATATLDQGLLEISLPRVNKPSGKKIDIVVK